MKCMDAYHKTHVTISVPREAGDNLKYLAKFNAQLLERLGILAIRVDGSETVTVGSNSSERASRERPPISSTSSGEKCTNLETGLATRSSFKKQASKSIVSSIKQSCNNLVVPYEGGFDQALTSQNMPNIGFSSCQGSGPVQWLHPSSSVFQGHCFNQHCSVNVSTVPSPSFAHLTARGRSHFDFGHHSPGFHLTANQQNANSPIFKPADLLHAFSSSNSILTTSNFQPMSSIGSTVLGTLHHVKVPKTRQRKKPKQCSSSRNYSGQECIAFGPSVHQTTSAAFIKHPSESDDQNSFISSNVIGHSSFMRPPCKRYSLECANNNNISTYLNESLSKSELTAKKCLSHFDHQEYKVDGYVAMEVSNIPLSSSSAINFEKNEIKVDAFSSDFRSSAGQLMHGDGHLSKATISCAARSSMETAVALHSSTTNHLDEKSDVLLTVSPRSQLVSFGGGDGVGTMSKCQNVTSDHVMERLKDETANQSEQGAVNARTFGYNEFCSNQLPMESFKGRLVHLLNENLQETCLNSQRESLKNTETLKADLGIPTSYQDSTGKMTVSADENFTKLHLDDSSTAKGIVSCIDSGGVSSSSPQQSDGNCTDYCVDATLDKRPVNESMATELFNLEGDLSVTFMEDIRERAGNISPDSAVVGDVTSEETIEESVSLLDESPPLDGHLESLCCEDAISSSQLVTMNQIGNIRDRRNDSVTDIHEINNSSEASICCESAVEIDESDELNTVKFAHVNNGLNINSDNYTSNPVDLTWSGLTNEDVEVIKLNNKHSALDLAVTRYEDVSRCSKGALSEDLRRLNALVVCEFDSLVVKSSSLFCVAKVTDQANSKVPRNVTKYVTRKLTGSFKTSRRHFSLYSLLAKRRMKRRCVGTIPVLNKESGHLNRCELNTSRPVSLTKKFHLRVARDL